MTEREAIKKIILKNRILTVPWVKTALCGYGYKDITAAQVTSLLTDEVANGLIEVTNLGDARRLGARTFERVN